MARRGTGRRGRRAVRRARDPAARGAAAARGRAGDRRGPRSRPARRGDRRARRADRRSTRCASSCTPGACSRCTAAGARRRPSRPTATRAQCWSSRSASSLAASCGGCRRRSLPRTRRSTAPRLRRPLRPGHRRRGRHRTGARVALIAAAAVLLLAGAAAFGISRLLGPTRSPGIDENYVGLIDPDGDRITKEYLVGRGPGAVVAGGGSTWVANTLDGTVSRIDRERHEVVTIDVGGAPHGLAFGAGSLWVADGDARSVAQVDPGTNKRASAHRGRQRAERCRLRGRRAVGRIRGRRDARSDRARPPPGDAPIPARLEPDRDRRRRRGALGGQRGGGYGHPGRAASGTWGSHQRRQRPERRRLGEGAVWVVNRHDGTLSRIDPATNTVTGTVRVGSDPTAVAAGGAVWVAGGEDGTIARVGPETLAGVERSARGTALGDHGRGRPGLGDGRGAAGRAPGRHASGPLPQPSEGALDRLAVDEGGLTGSGPGDLAGLRRPRRLSARQRRRGRDARRRARHRRSAAQSRRPDLRLHAAAGDFATPTAGPSVRRTSAPRWSVSSGRARPLHPVFRGHRRSPAMRGPARSLRSVRRESRPTPGHGRSPSTSRAPTATSCTS